MISIFHIDIIVGVVFLVFFLQKKVLRLRWNWLMLRILDADSSLCPSLGLKLTTCVSISIGVWATTLIRKSIHRGSCGGQNFIQQDIRGITIACQLDLMWLTMEAESTTGLAPWEIEEDRLKLLELRAAWSSLMRLCRYLIYTDTGFMINYPHSYPIHLPIFRMFMVK